MPKNLNMETPIMFGAGGGQGAGSSFVTGERLKEADTPVETLLGALNGTLMGGLISSGVSGLVTMANQPEGMKASSNKILKNITGKHLPAVLAGTAALAAVGGLVRYSRASKHNEWANKHYQFLEHQTALSSPNPQTADMAGRVEQGQQMGTQQI